MKIIYWISLFACIVISCQGQTGQSFKSNPAEACKALIDSNPDIRILDVRSAAEYHEQHIGNALNINVNDSDFDSRMASLNKSEPLIVYCLSGGRSKTAAKRLAALGFTDIIELDGGIMKWNAAGYGESDTQWKGMTEAEFRKLISSEKKVLISFYAEWCAPCKKMAPYLTKMQNEMNASVKIIRLDADENKSLLKALKIDELPQIRLYEEGVRAWTNSGYISEDQLRTKL